MGRTAARREGRGEDHQYHSTLRPFHRRALSVRHGNPRFPPELGVPGRTTASALRSQDSYGSWMSWCMSHSTRASAATLTVVPRRTEPPAAEVNAKTVVLCRQWLLRSPLALRRMGRRGPVSAVPPKGQSRRDGTLTSLPLVRPARPCRGECALERHHVCAPDGWENCRPQTASRSAAGRREPVHRPVSPF